LEKGVKVGIASFENECSVDIDYGSMEDFLQPANYVEHWRLILWDKTFQVYFDNKGGLKFIISLDLMEFEEDLISINCIAYQSSFELSFSLYCFRFILFQPPFFYSSF
jgi:hypothetical protein